MRSSGVTTAPPPMSSEPQPVPRSAYCPHYRSSSRRQRVSEGPPSRRNLPPPPPAGSWLPRRWTSRKRLVFVWCRPHEEDVFRRCSSRRVSPLRTSHCFSSSRFLFRARQSSSLPSPPPHTCHPSADLSPLLPVARSPTPFSFLPCRRPPALVPSHCHSLVRKIKHDIV